MVRVGEGEKDGGIGGREGRRDGGELVGSILNTRQLWATASAFQEVVQDTPLTSRQ